MNTTAPKRDLRAELERFDGFPASWKPKVGDIITGRLVEFTTGRSAFGACRIAVVQTDDGERIAIWLSTASLLSEFEREREHLKPGVQLGVKFVSVEQSANNRQYKRFRLAVSRPEPLTFAPLGGEEPEEPPEPAPAPRREPPAPRSAQPTRPAPRPASGGTPYANAVVSRGPAVADPGDPFVDE